MVEGIHLFGLFLVHVHDFDQVKIDQALQIQAKQRIPIGRLGLQLQLLNMKDTMRILEIQADTMELFGEIAVKHGFLSEGNFKLLLETQRRKQAKLGDILVDTAVLTITQRDKLLSEFHHFIGARTDR